MNVQCRDEISSTHLSDFIVRLLQAKILVFSASGDLIDSVTGRIGFHIPNKPKLFDVSLLYRKIFWMWILESLFAWRTLENTDLE